MHDFSLQGISMVMVPTGCCLFCLQAAEIQLLVQVLGKATSRATTCWQCRCGKVKTAKGRGHFTEKSCQGQKEKHIAPTESQHPLPKFVE